MAIFQDKNLSGSELVTTGNNF